MDPREYLKEPYTRVLVPDETGGYNAEVLEFPGCFAEGDTIDEAYRELEDAAESWIEVRLDRGQEVPPPFSTLDYSGNISLRLPRTIHKRAAILAERDRVSLNSFLMSAIAYRVGAEDFTSSLVRRFECSLTSSATTIAQTFTFSMPNTVGVVCAGTYTMNSHATTTQLTFGPGEKLSTGLLQNQVVTKGTAVLAESNPKGK
jgi:antitoxin HicB